MVANIEAEFWARWYADDYSWNNLSQKPANCYPSLKDYWIRTAGPDESILNTHVLSEIVSHPGQDDYHIAHLPLYYRDGTPTEKTTNPAYAAQRFEQAIQIRLSAQPKYDAAGLQIPVYFQGVVFMEMKGAAANGSPAMICSGAIFTGDIDFGGRFFFQTCQFDGAVFLKAANFNKALFRTPAIFDNAKFLAIAEFRQARFEEEARFDSAVFRGEVGLDQSVFQSSASFFKTHFWKRADFRNCRFERQAYFWMNSFGQDALFEGAVFQDHANFWNTAFRGRMNFKKCQFLKHANFCDYTDETRTGMFGEKPAPLELPSNSRNYEGAFEKAIFTDIADFSYWGFGAFSAFDGAIFRGGIKFDHATDAVAGKNFAGELASASGGDFKKWTWRLFHSGNFEINDQRDDSLRSLESGCRVLKQEMGKGTDKAREHMFYRFELRARRNKESTSLAEKLISTIYGHLSDYGYSIFRPQTYMLYVWALFALAYGLIFHPEGTLSDNVLMAVTVSASRMFPFGAFGDVTAQYVNHINALNNPGGATVFMALATLQSLAAIILAFLAALAVKRRFQIV